jgi:hypothetical protein
MASGILSGGTVMEVMEFRDVRDDVDVGRGDFTGDGKIADMISPGQVIIWSILLDNNARCSLSTWTCGFWLS